MTEELFLILDSCTQMKRALLKITRVMEESLNGSEENQ